jgi:hypothetical protein
LSAYDKAAALAVWYVEAALNGSPTGQPDESPWIRARYLAAQSELTAGRLAVRWAGGAIPRQLSRSLFR